MRSRLRRVVPALLAVATVGLAALPAGAEARRILVAGPGAADPEIDLALRGAVADVATPVDAPACDGDEACLRAATRAAGAESAVDLAIRPVGEGRSLRLRLLRADGGGDRVVAPLRAGLPATPAVRSSVFRLLAPERVAGTLTVEAIAGSEVWVDGERRGVAPLAPLLLAPGPHLLRVVRPGAGEARGPVEIRFEAETCVRVEPRSDDLVLVAAPARPVSVDLAPPAPAPVSDPATVPAAALAPGPAPRSAFWQAASWTLVGTGVATALGAVIPVLAAAEAREEARALRDVQGRLPPDRVGEDRRLADRAASRGALATTLLVTGSTLVVGGTILYLLLPDEEKP